VRAVDGERVLDEATRAYAEALSDRLLAAYALGSLAHGGFSPLVSDVDLGLIVDDPPQSGDPETIQTIAENEKRKGSALHQRLSVFWGTPATLRGELDGGRFPPLDRLDLIEHGRLLAGSDDARREVPRPGRDELLITGAEFALDHVAGLARTAPGASSGMSLGSLPPATEDAVEEILSPELLLARGVRQTTKRVLFPVRFMYTATTGSVGTNHAAVARYLEDSNAPAKSLVAAGLRWREAPPDHAGAVELLRAELVPLYLHYIADHIDRLRSVGEIELAAAFDEWRDRLIR
jgi:hypothetical protein